MSAPAQRSFAGGEIAPALYARTDQVKYATGLRTCRNMFIRRHGGATMRPGLQFIAEAKDSSVACRIARFVLDSTKTTDTYLLELGDGYIRFYQSAGRIVVSGVSAWVNTTAYAVGDLVSQGGVNYYCILAHTSATGTDKPGVDAGAPTKWYPLTGTIYEIPTPYHTADLPDLQFAQSGDVITIVHPSYAVRELKRFAHTRWTLSLLTFGPSIASPTSLALGSGSGSDGKTHYWAVTAIKEGTLEESLPALVSGTDKRPVSDAARSDVTAAAATDRVTLTAHGYLNGTRVKFLQLTGGTGLSASTDYFTRDVDTNTFKLAATLGGAVIDITADLTAGTIVGVPTTLSWDPVAGAISYNVYRSTDGVTYGLLNSAGGSPSPKTDTSWGDNDETASSSTPSVWTAAAGQLRNACVAAKADKAYDGKYTIKFRRTLTVAAGGAGAYGRFGLYYSRDSEPRILAGYIQPSALIGAGTQGPTSDSATLDVPDNGYTNLTIDIVPEIFPFSAHACTMNVNTATAPDNAINWTANGTNFVDAAAAPDYALAPPSQQNLFGAVGSYPAAGGYYQQRQLFANTTSEPQKVWASRVGIYRSFTTSTPLQADDTVSFGLAGKQVNVVKHLLDLARLLVFTTGSVLVIDGDQAGTLKPDAVNPGKVARQGIGRLPPLEVDDSAIYVQARGTIVRDLTPIEAGGAYGGYHGSDLTVFASHLFDGYTLADWAYAETPHSIVWAVRSDGVLLGLTYLREHAIWGWHRHDTVGSFENVCVVPEGTEDAIYVVVKRTINGATKRYIERFKSPFFTAQTDIFLLDAGLTYNGWHTGATTMTLSGGTAWDATEQMTLTASVSTFVGGDVGSAIFLIGADGSLVRCAIEAYTSGTVVKVRADRSVPAGMRAVAVGGGSNFVVGAVGFLGQWAKAVKSVSGLDHLEGKSVTIYADGFVVASPNNIKPDGNPLYTTRTVTAGVITLDQPYAIIHAGLPFIADFVPQEADAIGTTIKDRQQLTCKALLFVQDTRGVWIGRPDKPTTAKPLNGLQEYKPRKDEGYDSPPSLHTERIEVTFDNAWDKSGKYGPFLVRQVDPVPLTILALSPVGYGVSS